MSPRIPPNPPRRVEIVAFPDFQLLDVAGPLQALASANQFAAESGLPGQYEVRVVSPAAGVLASSAALSIVADPLPASDRPLDTLIIGGGPGVYPAAEDAGFVDWVRRRAGVARRTASVCTGAFLLAATGLLDGRRVTTHWRACARLAESFPALTVESDPIYINDGPFWTSAGVTAGIDLTLALIEADLGRSVSLAVARHLVVFAKRPGGQAQFSASLALTGGDASFDALHGWLAGNLRRNLTIPRLADRAGMSERSFARRYHAATGTTPARAVERLRVEAARQALAATSQPIKLIAQSCGFGSEETMRRSFLRLMTVSPQAYRERFQESA
ncbi:MAG TPA: GlxA family transcriptional regulator [Acetobacteraceae bacterium]